MKNTVARWIRARFAVVPDVSGAYTEPDPSVIFKSHRADVVLSTWMGARLYVYILKKAPRVRDLKNLLRDNSRSGIGALFVVDKALLPKAGKVVHLQDWWEALMLLNDTFIYTYYMQDDELRITQAYFEPTKGRDELRVWYAPEFKIEKVSVRRKEVRTGNIRGTWHIGDIASPTYKRRINDQRASQRFHYSTKYTQEIPREEQGKRAYGNGGARKGRTGYLRDDRLEKYYKLLGVQRDSSEKEIKQAFRKMALQ
ncbi:MAG: DnaJ domain-containing protein, partial [Chloroflexota bacterium]